MRKLIEKSIIASFSLFITYKLSLDVDLVFYFLIAIVISMALDLLTNKKHKYIIYIGFIALVFYDNTFLSYLPLIFYNSYMDFKLYSIFFLSLIFIDFNIEILVLSVLSLYLSESTNRIESIIRESRGVRDNLREDALYLKKYNDQLVIDKEKNIHIAILTERNRIAREIHDSIGHTISSSILQVKALKINSEEELEEPLDLLQNTLSNGMDNIRKSLKGLRDESLDLKSRIEVLIDEVPNLNIGLLYNIDDELGYNLKFDILSLVKEAITNTVKHSNATSINISLFSQPSFYSIIIEDNGDSLPNFENKGIGLDYMNETANKYNGLFNYKFEDGFKIHITLMKGK